MFGRTIASFVLGFAAGMLCLAAGLWTTGSLRIPGVPPPAGVVQSSGAIPAPDATPPITAPPLPQAPTSQSSASTAPPQQSPDVQSLIAQGKDNPPALPAFPPPELPEGGAVRPPKGEADRMVIPKSENLHIASPIAGLDLKKLADTFRDVRDGHEHEALDIMAKRGTPIHAVAEGNVVKLFASKQGGVTVYQFDNSKKYCFYYAHLQKYAPGLKEGTLLRAGDVLGYVGTSGNAPPNSPHLHFAVFQLGPDKHWWQGTAIDPLPLLK